jgi:Uma2 family endonuclease
MVSPTQPIIRHDAKTDQDWLAAVEQHQGGGYIELIEGVLIVAGGASPVHQDIHHGFTRLVFELMPGGQLYYAPLGVKLDDHNTVEPDILWYAPQTPFERESGRVVGIPDLIIEILSPGTRRRDLVDKFRVYERVGVREYWVSDSQDWVTQVFMLRDGKFALLGAYSHEETFESPILGKTVDLARVFAMLNPSKDENP